MQDKPDKIVTALPINGRIYSCCVEVSHVWPREGAVDKERAPDSKGIFLEGHDLCTHLVADNVSPKWTLSR